MFQQQQQQQQQQENFIIIILQKYSPQLARLFEAGQCVQVQEILLTKESL